MDTTNEQAKQENQEEKEIKKEPETTNFDTIVNGLFLGMKTRE